MKKIDIVKKALLDKFPGCAYTVKILLWDDGTDLVECRHGDGKMIYLYVYYNDKLTYNEFPLLSNKVRMDEHGTEFFVLTHEEYAEQLTQPKKIIKS